MQDTSITLTVLPCHYIIMCECYLCWQCVIKRPYHLPDSRQYIRYTAWL